MQKEFNTKIGCSSYSSASAMESTTGVIGTPQALNSYSNQQNGQVSEIVKCYVVVEKVYKDIFEEKYIVESTSVINHSTGCQYSSTGYFFNTTAFEEDHSYRDLSRFSLTSSAINIFTQTFHNNLHDLQGDQFAVACTTFCQQELGHRFCILVHPNETALLDFCRAQKWNYVIVNHAHIKLDWKRENCKSR